MNLPEKGERDESAHAKARKRALLWLGTALCLAVVGAVVIWRMNALADRRLKWMTQAELARVSQAGPLTQLKWKLLRMAGPLNRLLPARTGCIKLDVKLISLAPEAADRIPLPGPVATSADGLRAKVMANEEMNVLLQTLTNNRSAELEGGPTILTANGMQARVYQGGARIVAGANVTAGLTAQFLPKIRTGGIKLVLDVTSTEAGQRLPAGKGPLRTNVFAVCRVFIPNDGGLVLAGGQTNGAGKVQWVIIHALATDSKGKPLKL